MTMHIHRDTLLCRVFPNSLDELPLKWFDQLPPHSVENFPQLVELFLARFLTSGRQPKDMDMLHGMKKRLYESLREYAARFWEAVNDIPNCSEEVARMAFKSEIPKDTDLYHSLIRRPLANLCRLMARIEEYACLEEDLATGMERRSNQPYVPRERNRDRTREREPRDDHARRGLVPTKPLQFK